MSRTLCLSWPLSFEILYQGYISFLGIGPHNCCGLVCRLHVLPPKLLCDFYSRHIEGQLWSFVASVFQQDGAPFLFDLGVWQFLNENFSDWLQDVGQALGQHVYQICPHWTFFLWRHVKIVVCSWKPCSLDDLCTRITDAISAVTETHAERFCRTSKSYLALYS
jgi:hypothetical protein